MTLSRKSWENYIMTLRDVNEEAAEKLVKYLNTHDVFSGTADAITVNSEELKPFIDYAYAIVSKYGEAAASLAAEMYDLTAEFEGVILPPAELAPLAKYGDIAKAINGTIKVSQNYDEIASAATRWVKMAASDTTLHNAQRDGAQFAWIPSGDTCAFCLTLASRGWQYMSKNAMKNGHAEHIHSNCDCQYTIRHDSKTTVAGYDPDEYLRMYRNAEGSTPQERINSMRRAEYAARQSHYNEARITDLITEVGNPKYEVKDIINGINNTEVGQDSIRFIEDNNIKVYYDNVSYGNGNRGDSNFGKIRIYLRNNGSELVAQQTLVHEATHLRYDIGDCQHAEAICYAHEKMHKENRSFLYDDEWDYCVNLAKNAYPELEWEAGGYGDYGQFDFVRRRTT